MLLTQLLETSRGDVWILVKHNPGDQLYETLESCLVFHTFEAANKILFENFINYLASNSEIDLHSDTLRAVHDKPGLLKGPAKPEVTIDNMEDHRLWNRFNDHMFIVKAMMGD